MIDDIRHVVLFTIGIRAFAVHTVSTAQFSVVSSENHDRVVHHSQVVELREDTVHLAIAIADAIEVVILQALPAVIFIWELPHQSLAAFLELFVCLRTPGIIPRLFTTR